MRSNASEIEYLTKKWVRDTPGVPEPRDGRSFLTDPKYRQQVEESVSKQELAQIDAEKAGVEDKNGGCTENQRRQPTTICG